MRSTRGLLVLAGLATAGAVLWRRFHPFPVRVSGRSMEPALFENDLIAASPVLGPRPGDIVVVRTGQREVIKRVTAMHGGFATLEGDNRGATSNLVEPLDRIAGVAIFRYWPRPGVLVSRP